MEVEEFKKMMELQDYKRIDAKKFKNYTEFRDYQSGDMTSIDETKLKIILPEDLREKIETLVRKRKFVGHSINSSKNKPGNVLHKCDHIWSITGEKQERILFLMTKPNELTFFREFSSDEKDGYNQFLKEVSNKFANVTSRWNQYLE
jgi:hypothetical protein